MSKIMDDYHLIEQVAINGERCPQNQPHGPLAKGSVSKLVAEGRIRTEVYKHNWRVVEILMGEHKGKRTAEPLGKGSPYIVNGRYIR